jgi:DNA-binding Lrp family transcriptional regulator
METVTLDDVARGLVHALHVGARAPFSTIASVLGVSEHTVARRYRRLRSAGVLRVVGAFVGTRMGHVAWTIRLRCTPDAAAPIARSLAQRQDTFWVHLLSGGTEISCVTQTRPAQDSLLLDKLARSNRVISVTAHCMLQGFARPSGWTGTSFLSDEQVAALRPDTPRQLEEPVELTDGDNALFEALSVDGRAGHADLAAATGWSESKVSRRMDRLQRSGVLSYEVDMGPEALGYRAEARLWMSARPSALVTVAEALAAHREVSFAAVTTGPTNLVAAVICRDFPDLYRYLTERISALDGVTHVETAPVVRTVKRNGAVLPL